MGMKSGVCVILRDSRPRIAALRLRQASPGLVTNTRNAVFQANLVEQIWASGEVTNHDGHGYGTAACL
jgi:hypothetical protein